ncbi:MAG: hypothetical protein NXH94_15225 [Rhodobacteraceae bacterium]|jgi:hypothetical protein|uniref:hypothetical protein n=1 Tax=Marivita sp. TaxID=2003365 RepID=UPI003B51D1B8|nr:hypothetical protein [Paracoccaceae bacterium]
MTISYFLPILALLTLLAVTIFAYVSGEKARKRLEDPEAPKSTLAANARSDGKPIDV